MPPLPATPLTMRITLRHTVGTDLDAVSRFFISYTGTPPTASGAATFATAVSTAWGAQLKSMASNNISLTQVVVEDLNTLSGAVGTWTGSISGTRGASGNTAALVSLINFKIARRYRGGKPRIYLPYGVPGDQSTAQSWAVAFTNALTTAWAAFITALIAAPPTTTGLRSSTRAADDAPRTYPSSAVHHSSTLSSRARPLPRSRASVDAIGRRL
jgi:hypothetical protein